jgi:hypothetical protein
VVLYRLTWTPIRGGDTKEVCVWLSYPADWLTDWLARWMDAQFSFCLLLQLCFILVSHISYRIYDCNWIVSARRFSATWFLSGYACCIGSCMTHLPMLGILSITSLSSLRLTIYQAFIECWHKASQARYKYGLLTYLLQYVFEGLFWSPFGDCRIPVRKCIW